MPEESPVADPLAGLEITQYNVADPIDGERQTEVTYYDSQGLSYKRFIYVPRNEEGEVDQEAFDVILYQHLLSINAKKKVGAIEFTDLDDVEE